MTIKEFAQLAGVSISTVSKVMNQKDDSISNETRQHVLSLAKQYNYKSYGSISTTQTRSMVIGVLLRNTNELNMMVSGILATASELGYSVLIYDSADSLETERKNLTLFIHNGIDGLIWEPISEESLTHAPQLERENIPYIFIQPPQDTSIDSSFLITDVPSIDFLAMGYLATKELIDAGHIEIACLLLDGNRTEGFFEGYRRCLYEHNIPFNDSLVFHYESGLPIARIAAHAFSGMIISHYAVALELYKEIVTLRYSIPYDLSIISLRNDARMNSSYPPISTLTIPHLAYGNKLGECLISHLEKKTFDITEPIPVALDNSDSIDIPYCKRSKRVLSIGCINIDNYLNFDVLPCSGKTVTTSEAATYLGGRCLNEAIGLAKLGHTACIIGRVGNDIDADTVFAKISEYQIDPMGMQRTRNKKTGQAYIFVQRDGESMISVMSGANNLLSEDDLVRSERLFDNASYCMLQMGIPLHVTLKAAEMAKKHGLITVLKPSSCTSISTELLRYTDILVPNAEELHEICKGLCPESASTKEKVNVLQSYGVDTVIVTAGSAGCYIKHQDLDHHIPAEHFISVDSSGASDAFISALVAYLLYGYDVVTAAKIATYAAGFSITKQGVSPALIDKDTLEAYILQKNPQLLER